MKKGHRRTRSAMIQSSEQKNLDEINYSSPMQIVELLRQSQSKIEKKIISYQRLQPVNDHNNLFSFGNSLIDQINKRLNKGTAQKNNYEADLSKIKENSSQMSSQQPSEKLIEELSKEKKPKQKKSSKLEEIIERTQEKYKEKKTIPIVKHKKIKSFKIK